MKQIIHTSKNVVPEEVKAQKSFTEFMSNFTTIKKADSGFFLWDDRRVDYVVIKSTAKAMGIKEKNIPSEAELNELV